MAGHAPNLEVYLRSLKTAPLESSIESFINLLKRRQIRNSRPCAIATAELLKRVVAKFKWSDIGKLLQRIQQVGQRLIEAQPREMVVGNIVRRVLGMIRDEAKEDREDGSEASNSQMGSPRPEHSEPVSIRVGNATPTFSPLRFESTNASGDTTEEETNGDDVFISTEPSRPALNTSHQSYAVKMGVPVQQSMFNLLSATPSPTATPPTGSPPGKLNAASLVQRISTSSQDLRAEIISGVDEIIDELHQVDEQIAAYAQEHIHSNEASDFHKVILTHTSSLSVQKFLLKAAEKRKFTVIMTESYPNEHELTHAAVAGKIKDHDEMGTDNFLKPLSAAGITVILMTDASIFAIMSRVNKVILATHAVIANGGLVAAAGARVIAKAAKVHTVPVIVISGVYKLSPEYPYEFESLIEYGDPGRIIGYDEGGLVDKLEMDNPIFDYVPPDLVDLYITNLGAHAPSYLYRIVEDHYKKEDVNFNNKELIF